MEQVLFYASLLGTLAFGLTFIVLALRKPAPPSAPGGPEVEAMGGIPSPGQVAELAEKFGSSGPRATAASLTVFFFTAALVTSGVVEVSLDAGSEEPPVEETG